MADWVHLILVSRVGFYGDAVLPDDQGANFFTSPTQLATRFPDRDELIAVSDAWFAEGGASFVTFGYDDSAAAAAAESKSAVKEKPLEIESKTVEKTAVEMPEQAPTSMHRLQAKLLAIPTLADPKTWLDALASAANKVWFFYPFSTHTTAPIETSELSDVAVWCDDNTRYLVWTTDDENALLSTDTTDAGSVLQITAARRCSVAYSKVDLLLGVKAAGLLSTTDYSGENTYMDLNFKSVSSVGDDIDDDQIKILEAKGYFYNTEVAAKTANTPAMLLNTVSTSPYDETFFFCCGCRCVLHRTSKRYF